MLLLRILNFVLFLSIESFLVLLTSSEYSNLRLIEHAYRLHGELEWIERKINSYFSKSIEASLDSQASQSQTHRRIESSQSVQSSEKITSRDHSMESQTKQYSHQKQVQAVLHSIQRQSNQNSQLLARQEARAYADRVNRQEAKAKEKFILAAKLHWEPEDMIQFIN